MCTDCQAARETQGHWNRFNSLACQFCAARLIQKIGKLPISASEASARRRVVLVDACAWGQSEMEIRALVKGPLALAPLPERNKG